MRNYLFILFLIFSLIFVNSCAIRNSFAPKNSELAFERTFIAQRINNGVSAGYFNIPAKLVKTTDHLAIYLQTTYRDGISAYGLNKMAQEFDYYYDDMTNIYGEHSDIDGNGKIIIVLMDINVKKGGNTTLAYFNPNDMYDGNRGEFLYMDLSNANYSIDNSIGTLIHEFQHLINYNHYMSGKRGVMSSWLNEALSESTSVLFNKATAESRIQSFNNAKIKNYYCFYTWNLPTSILGSDGFVNYPSVSVFMHWLYDKGGREVFSNIALSTESSDYMKVLTAAKEISDLKSSVNTWEDLLLSWMSDLITNENVVKVGSTKATVKTNTNDTVILYPGAMVVSKKLPKDVQNNIVVRTNVKGGTNIILNKDTSLGNSPPYISVKLNGNSSASTTINARELNIVNKKEETRHINILLDRYGNIQEY